MGKERENDRAEETEEKNRKRKRDWIGRKQRRKMGKGNRE